MIRILAAWTRGARRRILAAIVAALVIAPPVSTPGAAAATEHSDQQPAPHDVVIATTILLVPVVPGVTDGNVPGSTHRRMTDRRTGGFATSVVNSPPFELCELLTSGNDAPSRYWQDVNVAQCVLDLSGMLPAWGLQADASSFLIYTGRGRFGDAAWSAAAFIPGLGTLGPVAKYVNRFRDIVRTLPPEKAHALILRVSSHWFWRENIAPRIKILVSSEGNSPNG